MCRHMCFINLLKCLCVYWFPDNFKLVHNGTSLHIETHRNSSVKIHEDRDTLTTGTSGVTEVFTSEVPQQWRFTMRRQMETDGISEQIQMIIKWQWEYTILGVCNSLVILAQYNYAALTSISEGGMDNHILTIISEVLLDNRIFNESHVGCHCSSGSNFQNRLK